MLLFWGNTTFVVANDGAAGREIFRVDGFTGIPRIALDHVPGPISGVRPGMTVLGNSIVFADLAQGVQVYDPATQQVQLVLPGGRVLGKRRHRASNGVSEHPNRRWIGVLWNRRYRAGNGDDYFRKRSCAPLDDGRRQ